MFALIPFAYKNPPWFRRVALAGGIVMVLNSLGHFAGTLYFMEMMPGMYSSSFLLIAAILLLVSVFRSE